MKKFTRHGIEKGTSDVKGRVVVRIGLLAEKKSGGGYQKGNISKIMTIEDAKVSEVFDAITKALF